MSGVKTSHSMGGARADRAPSVLQPPIPSHKPLGSGRTLARSYLAGFFRTHLNVTLTVVATRPIEIENDRGGVDWIRFTFYWRVFFVGVDILDNWRTVVCVF
eukprot:scaffold7242_cov130-Isochrysis_galbana.AAC.5